ncbi:MAG: STAS domain-containing protein [bacterium]
MDFSITVERQGNCTVIRVTGRLDSSTAPDLGVHLRSVTDSGSYKIVVNLKDVPYLSFAGLRELIFAWKVCRRWNRGNLKIAEPRLKVLRFLDLTGCNTKFAVFDSEKKAIESF